MLFALDGAFHHSFDQFIKSLLTDCFFLTLFGYMSGFHHEVDQKTIACFQSTLDIMERAAKFISELKASYEQVVTEKGDPVLGKWVQCAKLVWPV